MVEAHISKASCSIARIVPKSDKSDFRAPAPCRAGERFRQPNSRLSRG